MSLMVTDPGNLLRLALDIKKIFEDRIPTRTLLTPEEIRVVSEALDFLESFDRGQCTDGSQHDITARTKFQQLFRILKRYPKDRQASVVADCIAVFHYQTISLLIWYRRILDTPMVLAGYFKLGQGFKKRRFNNRNFFFRHFMAFG